MSDSVRPLRRQPTRLPVPGILQARTLERVAISFSNEWKWKVKVKSLCRVRLLATPMDCSPPGSSIHGIFQARVLERDATPLLRQMPLCTFKTIIPTEKIVFFIAKKYGPIDLLSHLMNISQKSQILLMFKEAPGSAHNNIQRLKIWIWKVDSFKYGNQERWVFPLLFPRRSRWWWPSPPSAWPVGEASVLSVHSSVMIVTEFDSSDTHSEQTGLALIRIQ